MATIASQFVLHPTVSKSLKYGATTLGRDKLYRAVQYYARFFAWYLLLKGRKEDAARWSALKGHLGTARKLMRLGKPVEHLQAALRATLVAAPPAEQITTIARQLSYFGYLTYDAIVWAHSIKFLTLSPETAKNIAKRAFQFWFAGIVFSLVNGTLKNSRLSKQSRKLKSQLRSEKDIGEENETKSKLQANKASIIATRKQLTIDLLDVWIPATGAGILNVNEGALGIAGLISSILGGKAQWEAVNGTK